MTPAEYEASLLEWALLYAESGWPVFPLHSPQRQPRQRCDCPDTEKRPGGNRCERPAKHPRTLHGLRDATCDPEKVARWWKMWPRANIGIAVPPGFVVVDVDGDDGDAALLERDWTMPPTPHVATARGHHWWFRAAVEIRPGSHFLPHVDMRGPGGYVVAPPSLHSSGDQYLWIVSPIEQEVAAAPEWVYELVKQARGDNHREPSSVPEGPIFEGNRNTLLTRVAGAMRRWGCAEQTIREALLSENALRCSPPLSDHEVEVIAESVSHYAPESIRDTPPIWEWAERWT